MTKKVTKSGSGNRDSTAGKSRRLTWRRFSEIAMQFGTGADYEAGAILRRLMLNYCAFLVSHQSFGFGIRRRLS